MNLETVIQSEVSQKEKNKYRMLTHICGTQKNGTDEPVCRAEIETQMQRANQGGKTAGVGGVLNWAIGIDMYTLICKKLMTDKNLQYKETNKKTKKTTNTKLSLGYLYGNMLI